MAFFLQSVMTTDEAYIWVQRALDVPLARGFSGGDDVGRCDGIVVFGILGIDERGDGT